MLAEDILDLDSHMYNTKFVVQLLAE